MLKQLGSELRVGIFAIVALIALGYMFFVLSPETFQNRAYVPYYSNLENAAGIVPKTQVKTAGVTVGKVKSVRLEDGKTRVEFEVDRNLKITDGSKIEIRSVGLLGDKHLEILRPAVDTELLPPGSLVPQSKQGKDLESMITVLSDISVDIKQITGSMAGVIGGDKGQRSIQKILDNIEAMSDDFRVTSNVIRRVVGDREKDFGSIVSDVRDTLRDLREASRVVRGIASEENRDRINHVLAQFDQVMGDVQGSVRNINLIAEKVEKGEGTVGKLINDDEMIEDLQGAIKDMRRILAPATKLTIDVDVRGEVRRDKTTQYWANILLRTRPDRYYLVGLSDRRFDTKDRRETVITGSNGETRTIESERKQSALRFDLQIAKRWYWLTLRGGLFQTTGGAGVDAHFFNDNLKLTTEVFDIDPNDSSVRKNALVKVWASALFYNHIYAMAGLNDITQVDPKTGKQRSLLESSFFGGGLTYNDEDLRAVFGTVALMR
ncbi:MAG: MCE family protein [Deltaproteobacteria bacterium]|nr:MCE family protein [Deltaproteobacteria bacterium]